MKEDLFRKKSLDKVKSPETLDDFIRVSNPGVWFLLVSVIVLLIGACVWGIFGHAESTYRDADLAKEMTEFTKNNILQQAATAQLAQANQQNQNIFELLQ